MEVDKASQESTMKDIKIVQLKTSFTSNIMVNTIYLKIGITASLLDVL